MRTEGGVELNFNLAKRGLSRQTRTKKLPQRLVVHSRHLLLHLVPCMSDTPLQLVLEFEDAYLVRDAIGVVRPSVLANATPSEIFQ
jgi:hypothetical protein